MNLHLDIVQRELILGIKKEELREHVTYGGVAAYIEDAAESKITLVF